MGRKMKLKKLLDKLDLLLSPERRQRDVKKRKLKELLGNMKNHERELGEQFESSADEEERAGLHLKKQILHEQRKKGVRLLRELKKERR